MAKSITGFLFRTVREVVLQKAIPCSRKPIFADGRSGVEVVGQFYTASGIGEGARLCARQLADAGYKVKCTSIEHVHRSTRGKEHDVDWTFTNTANDDDIGCRIIHLNPPMLPLAVLALGLKAQLSTYNIGYWAWELDKIPQEWKDAIGYVNAVFCPSDFTTRAIKPYTNKPVLTVPHPVSISATPTPNMREKLGLKDSTFLVSNIFSFGSAMERKNPGAAVDAFCQAFGETDDACLILKSNSGGESQDKKWLLNKIAGRANVRLIDATWTREDVLGLMKASNVYLSLHRSEGFGLPLAEAMLLGTPAVATNWSGNVDFCNVGNSYPVGVSMIPVRSAHPEFRSLQNLQWADANVGDAAAALRDAFEHPEKARAVGERAQKESVAYFSKPLYDIALRQLQAGDTVRRAA